MKKRERKKIIHLSVRLYEEDYHLLKKLAELDGLPYQALLRSVVHKYVQSRKNELKEEGRE